MTVWTELEPDIRDPDLPSMIKARGTTLAPHDEAVPHVVSNVLGIVTETEIEIETEIDEPRIHKGVCEPIGLQLRREDDVVELVWWFVAAVNEGEPRSRRHEERERERPGVGFLSYEDALATLTSADDRALVEKAIAVVNATQVSQKSRAATICFGQPK